MRLFQYIPALVFAFVLSACNTLTPGGTVDLTRVKQGAFALYGTYTVAREVAAEIKVACEKAPTTECRATVAELRRLDNIAAPKVTAMVTYARSAAVEVSTLQLLMDGAKLVVEQFQTYALAKKVS